MLRRLKRNLSLIHLVRKVNIQSRLSITFITVSILPIICLGLYAYSVYTNSLNDKLTKFTQQAVTLVNKNMMIHIQKYQELCDSISTDRIVQDRMPVWYNLDAVGRREVSISVDNVLNDKAPLLSYVNNVRLLNDKGAVVYDLGYNDIPSDRYNQIIADIEACTPDDSLRYAKTYRSEDDVVLGRKIFNEYSSSQHLGYVLISLNERLFSKSVMQGVDLGTNSQLMILDRDGNVISSNNKGVPLGQAYGDKSLFRSVSADKTSDTHSLNSKVNNEKSLITYTYNDRIGWYMVSIVPFSYINSETKSITESLIILSGIILVICIFIIFVIYTSIIKPIKQINAYCSQIAAGTMNERIQDKSTDEMGTLSRSVDHMVGEIQQLMDYQREDQKRQRELELNMLQSQINPHFLFNTLNTLKWIALINQVPVLSDGITSLSDLLRSTILNKEEKIPIEEEIKNINNYVAIQKLRYMESIDVVYHTEESLLKNVIPKFILQPVVENAIIHGTSETSHILTIDMIVRQQNDQIIIEVNDDGIGFDIAKLPEKSSKLSGIGIKNVDERIKLYYGEAYGLVITSEIGKGTHCSITFPKES